MKKISLFLISFLISFHSAFAETLKAPVSEADKPAMEQPASDYISDDFKLSPKSFHESNQQLPYTLDVTYPQITGNHLTPEALQFNAIVTNLVKKEMDRFKQYVIADMPHMKNLPDDLKHNSFKMDYDSNVIRPNGNTIISIRLIIEGMQAGRAHPYHSSVVLNYDLNGNRTLTLDELFKPKSNYLKVLSTYAKKKLNEKLTDKWMIDEGTKPLAKNFKNWNLEADGIVFIFDEYQVAPYVDGAQEISVPYADLKNILSPSAIIFSCIDDKKACLVQVIIPQAEEKTEENSVAI